MDVVIGGLIDCFWGLLVVSRRGRWGKDPHVENLHSRDSKTIAYIRDWSVVQKTAVEQRVGYLLFGGYVQ